MERRGREEGSACTPVNTSLTVITGGSRCARHRVWLTVRIVCLRLILIIRQEEPGDMSTATGALHNVYTRVIHYITFESHKLINEKHPVFIQFHARHRYVYTFPRFSTWHNRVISRLFCQWLVTGYEDINEYLHHHWKKLIMPWTLYVKLFAFSKRKLCNGENFRIKDFDEFRCFWGSWVRIVGLKKMYVCIYVYMYVCMYVCMYV